MAYLITDCIYNKILDRSRLFIDFSLITGNNQHPINYWLPIFDSYNEQQKCCDISSISETFFLLPPSPDCCFFSVSKTAQTTSTFTTLSWGARIIRELALDANGMVIWRLNKPESIVFWTSVLTTFVASCRSSYC